MDFCDFAFRGFQSPREHKFWMSDCWGYGREVRGALVGGGRGDNGGTDSGGGGTGGEGSRGESPRDSGGDGRERVVCLN